MPATNSEQVEKVNQALNDMGVNAPLTGSLPPSDQSRSAEEVAKDVAAEAKAEHDASTQNATP